MPDLVVIVPSRERPHAARTVAASFEATCSADTKLVFAVDDNDPTAKDYPLDLTLVAPSRNMGEALDMAVKFAMSDYPFAVAFMGDDHLPRTIGWDRAYLDALRELRTGIVYGNDLLQGERIPTQVAMTSDIVRALGFMAPPTLTHLYLDNFWLSLGQVADCIRYLPDVVVEHMHPVAKKAKWDASYARVNSSEMWERDRVAFESYARDQFEADVAKVKALRAAHV